MKRHVWLLALLLVVPGLARGDEDPGRAAEAGRPPEVEAAPEAEGR